MSIHLDLWDYRRRVAAIYESVRSADPGTETWTQWVSARDELFRTHSQTPLDQPEGFEGLSYFPYDDRWRTEGEFSPKDGPTRGEFVEIGQVRFEIDTVALSLPVYWLDAYGGGVFVPFRDLTSGSSTYGGGRYLLDTVKGADLGHSGNRIVVDFNYAYHPSCVHSDRWTCPLAAPESTLDLEVKAGERLAEPMTRYSGHS